MASLIEPRGNAMPLKYAEELIANARAISAPGKGILAADESTGTIGKRVRCVWICELSRILESEVFPCVAYTSEYLFGFVLIESNFEFDEV